MSKARIMGASIAGSTSKNCNVNLNTAGGNKKQGLPYSITDTPLNHHVMTIQAYGNNRDTIFTMNQLGGVGHTAKVTRGGVKAKEPYIFGINGNIYKQDLSVSSPLYNISTKTLTYTVITAPGKPITNVYLLTNLIDTDNNIPFTFTGTSYTSIIDFSTTATYYIKVTDGFTTVTSDSFTVTIGSSEPVLSVSSLLYTASTKTLTYTVITAPGKPITNTSILLDPTDTIGYDIPFTFNGTTYTVNPIDFETTTTFYIRITNGFTNAISNAFTVIIGSSEPVLSVSSLLYTASTKTLTYTVITAPGKPITNTSILLNPTDTIGYDIPFTFNGTTYTINPIDFETTTTFYIRVTDGFTNAISDAFTVTIGS